MRATKMSRGYYRDSGRLVGGAGLPARAGRPATPAMPESSRLGGRRARLAAADGSGAGGGGSALTRVAAARGPGDACGGGVGTRPRDADEAARVRDAADVARIFARTVGGAR